MKKILFIVFAIAVLVIPATGRSLTFNIDTLLTGTTPTGSAPWLRLTFTDLAANTVQLVIQSNLTASGEYIRDIVFNVDPLILPSAITFSYVTKTGSFNNPTINKGTRDAQDLNPGNNFDIDLRFATSSAHRFNLTESITYNLTYPGLTEDSFNFSNTDPQGEQYSGFYALAKFQGFPMIPPGDGSGKLGDKAETVQPVPEPSALILLGCGLIGLGVFRRMFRKS